MKRFLARWFRRSNHTPPLLQAEPRRSVPPPPPPAGRSGPPAAPATLRSGNRRRFRLILGGRSADGAALETEDRLEAEMEALEASPEQGEPAIHLVFSDGSSAPVVSDTPSGVRIRYLADNLLPPEDPASSR